MKKNKETTTPKQHKKHSGKKFAITALVAGAVIWPVYELMKTSK